MKNTKYLILALVFGLFISSGAFSQQITRFGVVDTAKVYEAFFLKSGPVRNYEKKKAEFQAEINKRTDELRNLQERKFEFENAGNEAQALRVEAEITKKRDYLTEYTNAKNVELESLMKSLKGSDEFYKKLYNTLSKIAESGGYSMILSLQDANAILWYSSSVDITQQVITELGLN